MIFSPKATLFFKELNSIACTSANSLKSGVTVGEVGNQTPTPLSICHYQSLLTVWRRYGEFSLSTTFHLLWLCYGSTQVQCVFPPAQSSDWVSGRKVIKLLWVGCPGSDRNLRLGVCADVTRCQHRSLCCISVADVSCRARRKTHSVS